MTATVKIYGDGKDVASVLQTLKNEFDTRVKIRSGAAKGRMFAIAVVD